MLIVDLMNLTSRRRTGSWRRRGGCCSRSGTVRRRHSNWGLPAEGTPAEPPIARRRRDDRVDQGEAAQVLAPPESLLVHRGARLDSPIPARRFSDRQGPRCSWCGHRRRRTRGYRTRPRQSGAPGRFATSPAAETRSRRGLRRTQSCCWSRPCSVERRRRPLLGEEPRGPAEEIRRGTHRGMVVVGHARPDIVLGSRGDTPSEGQMKVLTMATVTVELMFQP